MLKAFGIEHRSFAYMPPPSLFSAFFKSELHVERLVPGVSCLEALELDMQVEALDSAGGKRRSANGLKRAL